MGWSVQTIGAMFLRRQLKAIQRENLRKRITVKDLLRWGGEDGKLDRNEFALAKLLAQSKIKLEDIDAINKQFDEEDIDKSGLLDVYDILARKAQKRNDSPQPKELTTTQSTLPPAVASTGTIRFADHWFRHT